jgi:hypothetical protein
MTKIISISGKAGVGKSTLAGLIVGQVPGAVKVSFADALRHDVAEYYGIGHKLVFLPIFKTMSFRLGSRDVTGRELLQMHGVLMRGADPEYWVKRALVVVEEELAPLVVYDDVRYGNEFHALRERGAIMVRLDPYAGWVNTAGDHASETALDAETRWSIRLAPEYAALGEIADRLAGMVNRSAI